MRLPPGPISTLTCKNQNETNVCVCGGGRLGVGEICSWSDPRPPDPPGKVTQVSGHAAETRDRRVVTSSFRVYNPSLVDSLKLLMPYSTRWLSLSVSVFNDTAPQQIL